VSPSSSRRRAALAAVASLLLPAAIVTAPAATADEPDVQVLDIVAPVIDLALTSADISGTAEVEVAPTAVKVLLNANVLFPKDSPVLLPGAHARLRQVAADLRAKGPGTVRIVGYTDDLGSAEHGLVLSRQRAAAVSTFLRPLLPAADFAFTVTGRGEADPAAPNNNETNRRKNRRVELTYARR
jgi:outer membrane protein OmpA-like peptidoglycan-associated protein